MAARIFPKTPEQRVTEMGRRLTIARKAAGFNTAEDLADRLGIAPGTLYRYERGESAMGIDTLMDVAATLNVSEEYLLGNEELNIEWRANLSRAQRTILAQARNSMFPDETERLLTHLVNIIDSQPVSVAS